MKYRFRIWPRYQLASSLAIASLLGACVQSAEQPQSSNIGRITQELEQVVFFDDFSQGLSTDNWTETGEGDWNTESLVSGNGYPSEGSGSPAAHSDNCNDYCSIELTQPIDLSSAQSGRLEFLRFVSSYLDQGEYLELMLYNGSTWDSVAIWTVNSGADSQWHQEIIPLTNYLGVSDFRVLFKTSESSIFEHVHLDDVRIVVDTEGGDPCGNGVCDPSETCETCPGDCGECLSYDELFFDSFEDLSQWQNVGSNEFNTESLHASTDYPSDASGSPAAHADNCGSECSLVLLDAIDLSQKSSATLSFLRFVDSYLGTDEYLAVDLFDGSDWNNNVFYWTNSDGDDNRWHSESLDLSSYLGTSSFSIRIRSKSSSWYKHVHIDDLRVTAVDKASSGFKISDDLTFDAGLGGYLLERNPSVPQYRCTVGIRYERSALGGFQQEYIGARGDLYIQVAATYSSPPTEEMIEKNSRILVLENGEEQGYVESSLDILPNSTLILRQLNSPKRAPDLTLASDVLDAKLTITNCQPNYFVPEYDVRVPSFEAISSPQPDVVYYVEQEGLEGLWRVAPELSPSEVFEVAFHDDGSRIWARTGNMLDLDWVDGSFAKALAIYNRVSDIERIVVPNAEYSFGPVTDPEHPLSTLVSNSDFKQAFGLERMDWRFRMDLFRSLVVMGIGAGTVHLTGDGILELDSQLLTSQTSAEDPYWVPLQTPIWNRGGDTLLLSDSFDEPIQPGDIAVVTSNIVGALAAGWFTSYEQGEVGLVRSIDTTPEGDSMISLAGKALDEPFGMRFVYPSSGNMVISPQGLAELQQDPNYPVPGHWYVNVPCSWENTNACRGDYTNYHFHGIRNHMEDAICVYELGFEDAEPLVAYESDRDPNVVAQYEACFEAAETLEVPADVRLRVYRPVTLSFENIALRISTEEGAPGQVHLSGLMQPTFDGLAVLGPPTVGNSWSGGGLWISHSVEARFEQLTAKRTTYVVSIHQTAGSSFRNVLADDCHHAIDHAVWSYDSRIENMFSRNSDTSLESHPAFELTIENAIEVNSGCAGVRTFGAVFSNVEIVESNCSTRIGVGGGTMIMDPVLYREYDTKVNHCSMEELELDIYAGRDISVQNSEFRDLLGWGAGQRCRHGEATIWNNTIETSSTLRSGENCASQIVCVSDADCAEGTQCLTSGSLCSAE